jgi:Cu/Ag efflux protein CusF
MKPAEAAKPEEAKKEEVKKEAPPKPVMYRAGGIVLAVDAKAAKITLEQREVKLQRKLTLKVSKKEAQQLAGINAGDIVNVWVTGSTVTKLMKVF